LFGGYYKIDYLLRTTCLRAKLLSNTNICVDGCGKEGNVDHQFFGCASFGSI